MRRNAASILIPCCFSLAIFGCAPKKSGMSLMTDPATDAYMPASQESTFQAETYPTYGSPVAAETAYDMPSAITTASTDRYHTVARHDTLFALARTYYGDPGRWKDIYEANRSAIGNPNQIRVGQRLVIP